MFISRKAVIAGVSTLVLVGGGAALAYFTTTGTGQGTATVASVDDGQIELDFDDLALTGLYPGAPAKTTPITAENRSSSELTVENVVLTTVNNNKAPACDNDWFDVDVTPAAEPVAIAAGATESVGTVSVQLMNEATVNQDACQGATLTIDLATGDDEGDDEDPGDDGL
jgi:hypothetical protein